ncbi:hypothetical protein TCAL_11085 [Tigriopus californicus]|uniref:Flavin-containing monooxygenase n=1 Tax=Tigriopus californicus TaxID=6832 RepID=A0A553NZ15_TIGCA|nr:baeyer-Villiger monooxygenase-like isoform X2 [Tigriopus californicus]TRY70674.1 hypothetical protein TCAL_11085 [Tigriopus californicus]
MDWKIQLWMWNYNYGPLVYLSLLFYMLWNISLNLLAFLVLPLIVFQVYQIMPRRQASGANKYNAIVVGSGIAGLCSAVKLQEIGVHFTVLEKGKHLGGTWWWNTYPGAACDVRSHLYCISFFPNPWWSRAYAKGPEIHQYLKDFATYFNLHPHIKYNQKVSRCKWNPELFKWDVTTDDGSVYTANFVISACGQLHAPKMPTYKGLESFNGPKFHNTQWDHSVDLTGKRVGVLGTGASGVQVVPQLAKQVDQLYVFQRTATWVVPKFDPETSYWKLAIFSLLPITMTLYRWVLFWQSEMRFPLMLKPDSPKAKMIGQNIAGHHAHVLKDPEMIRKLTPTYNVGCKRITPSSFYLESFAKPNVYVETGKIAEVTCDGITTENGHTQLDAIIFATGFDRLRSMNAFEVIGQDPKINLCQAWGEAPQAYMGLFMSGYPNYFTISGPNTSTAHNSVIFSLECQTTHAVNYIAQMVQSELKSLDIKPEVTADHMGKIRARTPLHVFSTCVNEAYQNAQGVLWPMWPYSMVYLWWRSMECDLSLFDVK